MNCITTRIQRFKEGKVFYIEDTLLIEQQLRVYINTYFKFDIICTATQWEELIIGILFSKKIIASFLDIEKIHLESSSVFITLKKKKLDKTSLPQNNNVSNCKLNYEKLLAIFEKFNLGTKLFRQTGSVHSVMLLNESLETIFTTEDMGRHNAVDKAIGYCLKNDINPSKVTLIASSRMPLEILGKCYRAKILSVCSVSAPTIQSVEFARKNGMNLVGMFRGSRFNIYSTQQSGGYNE